MALDSAGVKTLMAVGTGRALGSRLRGSTNQFERFQQATTVTAVQPWIKGRWRSLVYLL